LYRFNAF